MLRILFIPREWNGKSNSKLETSIVFKTLKPIRYTSTPGCLGKRIGSNVKTKGTRFPNLSQLSELIA